MPTTQGSFDDVQPYGKYVFIKLDVLSSDSTKYLEQVAFNEAASSRAKLNTVNVYQTSDLKTRAGHVVPAGRIAASKEIRTDIDAFTHEYVTTVDGIDFYYHLYIPEGYETKSEDLENLPIVVHYPSGDYACVDYDGVYNGALYRHNDCTIWASEAAQESHPAFVLTIGASGRFPNSMYATYEELWATDVYFNVINKLIGTYNIDASRVYAISLAGGTTMMWNTIMEHPDLFAASISTSFDVYTSYSDPDLSLANMKKVLDAAPAWFFAGLLDSTGTDPFGLGRLKGERLRDIAYLANEDGYHIDVAFGEEGELMWNGMLRGEKAAALATAQVDRAAMNGDESLVTLFFPNTLMTSQHWSWTATYTNSGVRDWLFAQVKDTPYTPANKAITAPTLRFIGHASIMLETTDGTVIYVDPSYDGDYSVPADIILITHGHGDHNRPDLCAQKEDCVTITWAEALVDGVYKDFEIGGVSINAVPAANANHPIETSVGYVLSFDDIVFYHAGDTSMLESMAELAAREIDYAMYPVDGRYNMDVQEATVVAEMVRAKHSIPMHFVDLTQIQALQAAFTPEGSLYVNYGDSVKLEK